MKLRDLIKEQEVRLTYLDFAIEGLMPYYTYGEKEQEYFDWVEKTKRYIEQNFHEDKHLEDFNNLCNQKNITPNQQKRMVAILKAFENYPEVIRNEKKTERNSDISIQNTITNTQNQTQTQEMKILLKFFEDELSDSQLKELKQVVDEEKGDLEKAKPKVIDKIKSFGENVASNILANIITNPAIWSCLG